MNTPVPDPPSAPLTPAAASTLAVDIDGGLVRLHADYDPQLVEQVKGLPGRRFIAGARNGCCPLAALRSSRWRRW